MFDRWMMYFLFVFLSCEYLLIPLTGLSVARLIAVLPLALVAYFAAVVRPALSPGYRLRVQTFRKQLFAKGRHGLLFAAFVVLFLVSLINAAQVGALAYMDSASELVRWSSVFLVLVVTALEGQRRELSAPILRAVVLAYLVYAGMNVVFFFVGVQNEYVNAWYVSARENGLMFRLLGFDVLRAPLALGNGADPSGTQVAPGLVIGLALSRLGGDSATRRWGFILAVTATLCLFITDSRGGMMGAIVGIGAMVLPRMAKRQAKWIAVALPILPLALMLAIRGLADSPLITALQRTGESSVGALSGRPLIWGSILTFLSNFDPQQLIGYGAKGQVGSGVGARYGVLFATEFASPNGAGAHNTFLQAILDIGYLGAGLEVALYWLILSHFGRVASRTGEAGRWGLIGLGVTVALVVLGVTSETLGIARPITLALFMALNLHCLTTSETLARMEKDSATSSSLSLNRAG